MARTWTRTAALAAALAVGVLGTASEAGADYIWTGTTSTDWNDAGNWSGSSGDYVIDSTPTNVATMTSTAFSYNLTIAAGGTLRWDANANRTITGDLTFAGGTFTIPDTVPVLNRTLYVTGGNLFVQADTTTVMDVTASSYLYLNPAVSGSGTITKTGAGGVLFKATSTDFTGRLNIDGGYIRISNVDSLRNAYVYVDSGGTLGQMSVKGNFNHLYLNGGTLANHQGNSNGFGGDVEAVAGTTSYLGLPGGQSFTLGDSSTVTNTLHGSGNLIVNNGGNAAIISFSPSLTTTSYTGVLQFNSGSALKLRNTAGTTAGGLHSLAGDAGTVNYDPDGQNTGTYTLTLKPAAGADNVYSGLIRDGSETGGGANEVAALVINGDPTGRQTLSGNSGFRGGVTLTSGILILNNNVAASGNSPVGAGSVTLAGGTLAIGQGYSFDLSRLAASPSGTLAGKGEFLGAVTGLAVAPGLSVGTLTVDGDVTLAGNSVFEVDSLTAFDILKDDDATARTLTYGGTLTVNLADAFSAADAGDFQLFQFGIYVGDFSSLTVNGLDEGLAYQWAPGTGTLSISAVPEPATLAFLAFGGLAMAGAAVRRRQA